MCSFRYAFDISGYIEVLYHPKTVLKPIILKSAYLHVSGKRMLVKYSQKVIAFIKSLSTKISANAGLVAY